MLVFFDVDGWRGQFDKSAASLRAKLEAQIQPDIEDDLAAFRSELRAGAHLWYTRARP